MPSFKLNKLFFVLFVTYYLFYSSHSTTHWFLNDEGKIQAQMDSIYQLRRPYDFLALLQQENRARQVEEIKKELIDQKAQIDKNEDKDLHLEDRIYSSNPDCLEAGKPLTEFDLYASASLDLSSTDVNLEEHLDLQTPISGYDYLEPHCSHSKVHFSLFLLEHLKGMVERQNLTAAPEEENFSLYGETDSSIWGHRVAVALQKEKSSWVLFTFAAQFWRIRGEVKEAIECIRVAVHLSPRGFRFIPLFYLGNIFHRSRASEDAAIVLHMALDLNPKSSVIHEMLGCVYAAIGYYNESVTCFENAIHFKGKDENLVKLKHAVLCHAHVEEALEKQLQSLQKTLAELRVYQKKHDEWLALQQKLLLEQATPEMKLESRLEYEEQKIRESADGRGQDCFQYQQDGHTFLSCNMRRDQLETQVSSTELLLDLQSHLRTVEAEAMRLGQQVLKRKSSLPSNGPFVTPLTQSNERSKFDLGLVEDVGAEEDLFGPKDCNGAFSLPPKDSIATVFLPTENKQIEVKDILERVSMIFDEDLTPVCDAPSSFIDGIDSLDSLKSRGGLTPTQPDIQGSTPLTVYGFHLYDTETEVKLASALKQGGPSRWIFANLACLYWRIYGNLANSLDCVRLSISEAPPEIMDVPLVNLASLLYRGGHLEDALAVALQAADLNSSEVETNFLLGNLYQVQGDFSAALSHYQQVLSLQPRHAEARRYYNAVFCHLQTIKQESEIAANAKQNQGLDSANKEQKISGSSSGASESEEATDNHSCPASSDSGVSENSCGTETKRPDSGGAKESGGVEDDSLPEYLSKPRPDGASPKRPPGYVCDQRKNIGDLKTFTSTWLAVSAKGINLEDYLVPSPQDFVLLEEPICPDDFQTSLHTFDHLAGVKHRDRLPRYPETGLEEAFQTLVNANPQDFELVATRIARSLSKNGASWVVPTVASLYWRVIGNPSRAIDCLRMALHNAPWAMKDVPLTSLANVFYRCDLLNDALIVASMALEISPQFVVIHFTLANIYAKKSAPAPEKSVTAIWEHFDERTSHMHSHPSWLKKAVGDLEKAVSFYQSTLALQSSFEPARERLRLIQCSLDS